MLAFLNVFFFVFHTLWMLFNCVGWIWKRTRPWHLLTIVLTGASWFVLGFWYGWGYCLCTDWHWQIREKLGYSDDYSYTNLLFNTLTGLEVSARLSDLITGGVFFATAILSVVLNVRYFFRGRRLGKGAGNPQAKETGAR